MSACKRLIARLDVKGKKLIKGIRFEGLRVIGDACDAAENYASQGIDEIFYTDAVASLYGRNGLDEILRATTKKVFVPITAGGAIRSVEDGRKLLAAGADKLAINSAAIKDPNLINKLSKRFGKQCVVVSIQVVYSANSNWEVMIESGRERTSRDLLEWITECQMQGAGEIFVTSVDRDGTESGPDLSLLEKIIDNVKVPLVFGGGFSSEKDLIKVFGNYTNLSGISLGSALHYKNINISSSKENISKLDLPFRKIKNNLNVSSIQENISASIIDYGMGNTQSLINAFSLLGIKCQLTTDFEVIENNHICILPGVGAYPEGMKQLHKFDLIKDIKEFSNSGGCLLGICLGMQLLLTKGTEYEKCDGLDIIPGTIEKLPDLSIDGKNTILPHVGWNTIKANDKVNNFATEYNNVYQYFVHSYGLKFSEEINYNTLFSTDFEGHKIVSMVRKKNTVGMQFHPERSGRHGLNLIRSTVKELINNKFNFY